MYATTSYNRTVYASAQKRLGLHSARSPKGSHASFRQIGDGGLCFAKPLYAAANFVNSQNVVQHFRTLLYWNKKELRDSFCPTFIRLSVPSMARGFRSKDG